MNHPQGHKANDVFAPRGAWQSDVSASKKCLGYDPFGSLLPGRNFSSGSYRFGFNGQEKDDEINGATGTSYTAEFWQYDPRIGRRWNIDPVIKHWESPYAAFNDNPIVRIDPRGNNAGDYHDKKGKKVGTDGIDDGKIHIVTDKKEIKDIRKQDKAGGVTPLESVGSAVTLPGLGARKEMAKVIDMDKQDPFREYGGLLTDDEDVLWAKPGPTWDGGADAEINTFDLQDPSQLPNRPILGTFHSHPSGTITKYPKSDNSTGMSTVGGVQSIVHSVHQLPSDPDISNAESRASRGVSTGNSYVIGAGSQQVSIYNGTGTLVTIPLSKWTSLGR